MLQEEKEICAYLKGARGDFVSAREICRRAGGKRRHRDDPHWAIPWLKKLLESGAVETNSTGHYRIVVKDEPKERKKKWVSPQMRRILENSGKDFTHIIPEEESQEL